MSPRPSLQALIDIVRADSASEDPLVELSQAAVTVSELEEVGDSLLDHFVYRCRRAGRSWSEISSVLGVSKQAAHKRFAGSPRTGPSFERFTERARLVLGDASEQARKLGHQFVGTEHLLLALFEPADALAAQVLRESGIRRSQVETKVVAETDGTDEPVSGEVPYTPRALDALRHAVEEAVKLGHNYIGTEHLLLGLFDETDALASKILLSLGANADGVRQRLTEKFVSLTRMKEEDPNDL